jgi:histidinol-phosphate aminotransferase
MYPVVTAGMGATAVQVPLSAEFVHDLPAMRAAVTGRTRLVMVCNPNNPTGTSVGRAELDAFAASLPPDVVLAIDEAYVDFARRADFPDSLACAARRPGTLVVRTFSKNYGLAGLRIGYGIGDTELIGYLERARHPFNLNLLAEEAAVAALDDSEHLARTLRVVAEGLDYFGRELPALGVRIWPSDANFLLADAGVGAYEALLAQGVIVRPLAGFGLPGHIRISIGTAAENERCVKALAAWTSRSASGASPRAASGGDRSPTGGARR